MLEFLYYRLFLVVKLISIISGIYLFKDNKNKFYVCVIYYGFVSGTMLGYLINERYLTSLAMSSILIVGSVLLNKFCKVGEQLIIEVILTIQYIYITARILLRIIHIDFYEILNIYPDLVGDYLNLDFALLLSVILTAILVLVFRIVNIKCNKELCYWCMSVFFVSGGILAHTGGAFEITGEWQDLFLPWLNIEYGGMYKISWLVIMSITIILIMIHRLTQNDETN